MSALLKFITIMQKILIIICILCFIPTSIFVFAPRDIYFSISDINVTQRAYQQVFNPFIINTSGGCTYNQSLLNNNYCFSRAQIGLFNVKRVNGTGTCLGWSYQFNGLQFCSGYPNSIIYNEFNRNLTQISQSHNKNVYPIFKISQINLKLIQYYHHIPKEDPQTCKTLAETVTQDPSTKHTQSYYIPYKESSRLLWFYTLPIMAALIILIVINEVSNKFNLRKYVLMACFCINVALITLIIKGALYYSQIGDFKMAIFLFSECFFDKEQEVLASMSSFDNGVGFGFMFFMGLVALIIFLSMVGQLVAKLLEMKYYSSRDRPEQTGVELSDLMTSLRSRRIKESEVAGSSLRSHHKNVSIELQQ